MLMMSYLFLWCAIAKGPNLPVQQHGLARVPIIVTLGLGANSMLSKQRIAKALISLRICAG